MCLKVSVMGRSILLCLLHHAPRVGLVLVSYMFMCFTLSGNLVRFLCVFYTECQVLVCVLVVLTPSDNCWSALLCFLHRVPRVGLCSNISYTMYHGLSVFVRLNSDLVSEVCPCLCVS